MSLDTQDDAPTSDLGHGQNADSAETVTVRGLSVSTLALSAAAELLTDWAGELRPRLVVTPNTDHFLRWQDDERFRMLYERADLRTVDGAPLAALARRDGTPPPPRVTGVDLFGATVARAAAAGIPIVIIGGEEGVAAAAAAQLVSTTPGVRIAFTASPSRADLGDEQYLRRLTERLARTPHKVVALCLGSPKQEQLFADLERIADGGLTGVYLCVGATVDFLAGRVRRSPVVFRRLGLEWLYRLVREPRRLWRRYLVDDVKILRYFAAPSTPKSHPVSVDRLIIHMFDPSQPAPGGIDTCIRGLCRYMPDSVDFAVVGVDSGHGPAGRRIGRWEQHISPEGRPYWFLPVAAFDHGDQKRFLPHSLRLMAGVLRHRRRLPEAVVVQAHRMDTALAAERLLRRPLAYFVHTQDGGLTGAPSDSYWRFAAGAHRSLERGIVQRARSVVVFNEDYAKEVQRWNPRAFFSPTWYDPAVIRSYADRDPFSVVWAGRLEKPKDPGLALDAFSALATAHADEPWKLAVVGDGTLRDEVRRHLGRLPEDVRRRIDLRGRVPQSEVAEAMGAGGVFLMTSFAGYEGYARVLVEAMASGLPAVVTEGSDTGHLVEDGVTGYTLGRDAEALGAAIRDAAGLDRVVVHRRVEPLDAPSLVHRIVGDVDLRKDPR